MPVTTENKFKVSDKGTYGILIGRLPLGVIDPDDALNLAAWLVVVAEDGTTDRFSDVLDEVRNSR